LNDLIKELDRHLARAIKDQQTVHRALLRASGRVFEKIIRMEPQLECSAAQLAAFESTVRRIEAFLGPTLTVEEFLGTLLTDDVDADSDADDANRPAPAGTIG
jgi:hypothetical protein